ncbi:MAG: hypothetical protein COZ65_02640 [Caldiserica bacterium CG_4_8_14_3_um_filter_35_18]|nr:MAG: hypothetical protein COZ65_02640 [Caldiserica bacterium CG_4_8_14_3_um_filter_35_18]
MYRLQKSMTPINYLLKYNINDVKTLKQLCIIKGDGKGYLKPHELITREEIALIAYRIIKVLQTRLP